ncbi:helix-turn-helix transcriptional regulator [Lacticaseibacillus manihotivorans]|uniref:helix-turn-helix transcriptional regulator n=1 Tax=Lacticaseibacillus manihotivorans TaxID=88233 RepID=UPI0006CFC21F|nr:HTH domain-containing protein [Lacticaseibacillus manihotivorans]
MQTYRLINIVMMLLAQDTISAQTFADLFQVTKRTILRDMDHLSAAHIPVVATRGVNGGFRLLDTYKIDKRLLSVKDLQNILAAVQGLDALLVDPDVAMTLTKVSGLLPTTKKPQSRHRLQWSTEFICCRANLATSDPIASLHRL